MKKGRIVAMMVAMLVVGLVAGNVAGGWAATAPESGTSSSTTTVAPGAGLGLRMGAALRDAGGRLVDVVAKLTGLDVDDVIARRAEGESIEKIAESEGVKTDAVVDEALKVREQLLDERVKAGTITQEQADAAIDRMETRLNDRVTSTDAGCNGAGGAGGGMGGGRGGGMGGGRGMRGGPQAPVTQ